MIVDRSEVIDVGQSGFVEQGCGDAEHGEVDQPCEAEANDAVPLVECEQGAAFVLVGRGDPVLLQG